MANPNRYVSIEEVLLPWRSLKGVPLTLEQIEAILQTAEASTESFAVAHSAARQQFTDNHHVVAGQWVAN